MMDEPEEKYAMAFFDGQNLFRHAKDAFGHTQLGGVAPTLVDMIKAEHGYKCHWSVADYLQRAARHIADTTRHDAAPHY